MVIILLDAQKKKITAMSTQINLILDVILWKIIAKIFYPTEPKRKINCS